MPVTTILLAAGYATRLHPLTQDRPKALLPLGRGVMLDEVIATLPEVPDLAKTVLVTNHRFAAQFTAWQRERQAPVQVVDDGTETADTRLGAIRDLELARQSGRAVGDLLVLGTDNLFRWPLARFVAQARRHQPHASVALWQAPSREAATQFGVVQQDATGRITQFVEKSPTPPSASVALCVYYFPEPMGGMMRRFISEGGNTDAPGHFVRWLSEHQPVYGIPMDGAWYDIGTLDAYQAALREWGDPTRPGGRSTQR